MSEMNPKRLICVMAGVLLILILVQGVQAAEMYVYESQWGTLGTGNDQFTNPIGIAMQGSDVYVTDNGNNDPEIYNRWFILD